MSLTDGDLPTLEKRRDLMLQYLRDKVETYDLHAIMDAAADLREIEAAIEVLKRMENTE